MREFVKPAQSAPAVAFLTLMVITCSKMVMNLLQAITNLLSEQQIWRKWSIFSNSWKCELQNAVCIRYLDSLERLLYAIRVKMLKNQTVTGWLTSTDPNQSTGWSNPSKTNDRTHLVGYQFSRHWEAYLISWCEKRRVQIKSMFMLFLWTAIGPWMRPNLTTLVYTLRQVRY